MRVEGRIFESTTVRSGVRQGCPISPLIFVLCADILIKRLEGTLIVDEVVRAFADDTAVVLANCTRSLPYLVTLFHEFESISALSLNIDKTIFIPLWQVQSWQNVRALIQELCPLWGQVKIQSHFNASILCLATGAIA